jgi:hypothetical protein
MAEGRGFGSLAPFFLPLLASLWIPLAMAATISSELVRARDFAWPVGLTLGAAAVGWLILQLLTGDAEKASLGSVATILAYSTLGSSVNALRSANMQSVFELERVTTLAYLVALGLLAFALVKVHRPLGWLVRFATVMASLLVAWNAAVMAWERLGAPRLAPPVVPRIPVRDSAIGVTPDVYVIVLDKYTSPSVLQSEYGFDNTPFLNALRERGFVTPTRARANYNHTFLALAAMLNVRYVDEVSQFGKDSRWHLAYPLIENSRVVSFLRARGYRFVFFPSEFDGTRQNRYADVEIPAAREVRPEVYAAWVYHTAAPVLRFLACEVLACEGDPPPYLPASPSMMDWRLRALGSLSEPRGRPMFVFAHLLIPHEPFMYGPDCSHRTPFWPRRSDGPNRERVSRAYVDQIQCVNSRLLQLVDSIRTRSAVPPVILLQSDHGHGRVGRNLRRAVTLSPGDRLDRTSVFAAYLLPGVPADSVPDSVSPVNAMRLVLRRYFNADLPPLSEKTYWSETHLPYLLERVE